MIPSREEALALHRKYGSNQKIVDHCEAAERVSGILTREYALRGKGVDEASVEAGSLLHDIGRTRTHEVSHGMEGARILEAEGVDNKVVEIVRRHVGAGISPEEAKAMGLPDYDYIPRSPEERIVCFSDKLLDGSRVRPFEGEVQRFVKKGHDVERLLALRGSLADDLGEDPEGVVFDKVKELG